MVGIALASFLIPFVSSLVLTRLMMGLSVRAGLVDRPAGHKLHAGPTPLGGGIAVFLAVAATMGLVVLVAWLATTHQPVADWLPEPARRHAGGILSKTSLAALILLASAVQTVIGLIDDRRHGGLDYRIRLAVEVLLGALLVSCGVRATLFTDNLWVTAPITVAWIVGLTNAMNFLDNMDGLSAGVGLYASLLFAVIAWWIGELFVFGGFLVLAGALAGFLHYNWAPARIFLGDAGSNFLGFWIGVLTVIATFHTEEFEVVTILSPLCVLAVPLYDTVTVVGLRLLEGRSPFAPDNRHFSHRLVALGFRPSSAVLLIHLLTVTTGLGGLLLYYLRSSAAAVIVLVQIAGTLGVIALLEVAAGRHRGQ